MRLFLMRKKHIFFAIVIIGIVNNCMAESNYHHGNCEKNNTTICRNWIVVDMNGNGDYYSIQKAIGVANSGDVIFIEKGEYYEDLMIEKPITLIGDADDQPRIVGNGSDDCISIYSDNVSIYSISVNSIGSINNGMLIENVDDVAICDCIFHVNGTNTIKIKGSKNIEIINNSLTNGYVGISVYKTNSTYIINNTIKANEMHGIEVSYSFDNYLSSNSILNNRFSGMKFFHSNNNSIMDNLFAKNGKSGMTMTFSDTNRILKNNISENDQDGISLLFSNGNIIVDNTFYENDYHAISLDSSMGCNITNNAMLRNGIHISGSRLDFWTKNDIDSSNIVNNKPLCLIINKSNIDIPQEIGQLIIVNSSDSAINQRTFSNCSIGLLIGFSKNISIENCTFSNNDYGIQLEFSSNVKIKNNNLILNDRGLLIGAVAYDKISTENIIEKNHFSLNSYCGILCTIGKKNIIKNNSFNENGFGIKIEPGAHMNKMFNNTFYKNEQFGVFIHYGDDNEIYLNDFLYNNNNGTQAHENILHKGSWWNNTEKQGNYWSDYEIRYPNATTNDYVWSMPYVINGSNIKMDFYPSVSPFNKNYDGEISFVQSPIITNSESVNHDGEYTIFWTSVTNASGYHLQESHEKYSIWSNVYFGNQTNATFINKENGTYGYRVKAVFDNFSSNWSETLNITVIITPSDILDVDNDTIIDKDDAFPSDPAASEDSDSDGYPDKWNIGKNQSASTMNLTIDEFPKDPAASKDTDEDGYPDYWNTGKTEEDSTTGLTLDAFPDDPTEWNDTDSDGVGDNSDIFPEDPDEWEDTDNDTIGDNSDAFPTDPSASIDSDDDGFPDSWNPGMNETNSTTGLHLDDFPADPSASIDTDGDGLPDSWNPGMGPEDSTTGLTLDPYPNDPDNIPPDDTDDDDTDTNGTSSNNSNPWIWIAAAAVIVVVIALVIVIFLRKKPPIEPEDDHGRIESKPPPTKKRHQ